MNYEPKKETLKEAPPESYVKDKHVYKDRTSLIHAGVQLASTLSTLGIRYEFARDPSVLSYVTGKNE